jgi:hypothetical protein
MLTKALVLTDGEADLLSSVLEEVKTKTVEESQIMWELSTLLFHISGTQRR